MTKLYFLTAFICLTVSSPVYAGCVQDDPRCTNANDWETYDQKRQRIETQQYEHYQAGGTIGSYETKYGQESPPPGTAPFPGYNSSNPYSQYQGNGNNGDNYGYR